MRLRLYNTFSQQMETLDAPRERPFGIYCCGPTVYGPAHIGNFRTYLIQDVLLRVIKLLSFDTCYVRNLTDVDDKTIRGSQAENKSLKTFTEHWTKKFHEDCQQLHLLPPTHEPKATETIQDQIDLIKILIEKGNAYVSQDGSVYFRIASFKDYGRLSNLDKRQCVSQALNSAGRPNDADEYERESIGDFALWKARKPSDGEVYWSSPWGSGRPGWHIECSAMARRYLGQTVDLHAGGIDLCFPHHENEIAQSEAAYGGPFVKHWFHIAHLKVEGQKMSKSLGNLHTLDTILKKNYTVEALRYALLSGHYRQPLNFTFDLLTAGQNAMQKIYNRLNGLLDKSGKAIQAFIEEFIRPLDKPIEWRFFGETWASLLDDLNVPKALGCLFSTLHTLNWDHADTEQLLKEWGAIFFAFGFPPQSSLENHIIPLPVRRMAERRWLAKQSKNFEEADEIRCILENEGWQILDSKESYKILPKVRL